MPMRKKNKKKNTPLSSPMRAFAIAGNFPAKSPSEFRAMLPNFKQKYQSYLDALQIEAPHSKITRTSANQSTIDKFCAKENFTLFSGVTRDLILGYWLSNKVVYKIPPETLQFLENEFKIEHIGTDSNELIKRACKNPIYIELPDDAPVNSFFCGYTYLISKKLGSKEEDSDVPVFTTCLIENTVSRMIIHRGPHATIKSCIEAKDDGESFRDAQSIVFRLIAYIAYVSDKADAPGTVLIQGKEPYPCYTVLPIPFKDSLVDFTSPIGWIQSGMCNHFGFLSRQNMVADFIASLKETSPTDFILDFGTSKMDSLLPLLYRAVLSWEEHKVVYQYTSDVGLAATDQYSQDFLANGISSHLADYIPHQTIVQVNSDTGDLSMSSLCRINPGLLGILHVAFFESNYYMTVFPFDMSPQSSPEFDPRNIPALFSPLCTFIHILKVLERKTTKKEVSNLYHDGVPTPSALTKPKVKPLDYVPKEAPILRIGGDIAKDSSLLLTVPVDVYNITPRTVKKMPRKEIASRGGFRMSPHIRQSHPHNYWVGKGKDKHLEVRYLKSIKVNAGKKDFMPTTVVRNVK